MCSTIVLLPLVNLYLLKLDLIKMIVQKLIFELSISLPPAVIAHWQYTLLIIQETGLESRCWHQAGGGGELSLKSLDLLFCQVIWRNKKRF
jgi:hypothetical protein